MFKNVNALPSTYLGDTVYATGASPFVPTSYDLETMEEQDGLPTFKATMLGINSTLFPNPYFYIDFSSTNTVAWGVNCTHKDLGTYVEGLCSTKPTLMHQDFNGTELPSVTYLSDFNDAAFGGYEVSGTRYMSEVCFGGSIC